MKTEFKNVKEHESVKLNTNYLMAFEGNFKPITIEKENGLFKIFQNDHMINFCTSIEELNGWLYGCVQANNKRIEGEDEI